MTENKEFTHKLMYCDGGVIGKNPSLIAGTWCFCWVEGGEVVLERSGMVTPLDIGLPKVTNNLTELLAAVNCLESVDSSWDGTIFTDSLITLRRITYSDAFAGIPRELLDRTLKVRRNRKYKVELVAGHPGKKELELGYNSKSRTVSKFNVFCDEKCQKLTKKFMETR